MPDSSVSSRYVVPNFSSMHLSYLLTTSLPLLHWFPHLCLAVRNIFLLIPLSGSEYSTHSSDSHPLSSLQVTRGLEENGNNCLRNVGATQPSGIFLSLPSRKLTQLCQFANVTIHLDMVHSMDLLLSPIPPSFLAPPSIFPI